MIPLGHMHLNKLRDLKEITDDKFKLGGMALLGQDQGKENLQIVCEEDEEGMEIDGDNPSDVINKWNQDKNVVHVEKAFEVDSECLHGVLAFL